MSDPEFQKKLANMSDEEKMKIGMEMAKEYHSQNNNYTPEPKSVVDLLAECNRIDALKGQYLLNAGNVAKEKGALKKKYDDQHSVIKEWLNDQINKLPEIKTTGDITTKDPGSVKGLELIAADKHIKVENDYLKEIIEDYNKTIQQAKQDYSEFENLLAKIHYGDDAHNALDLNILASHQSMILQAVVEAASKSKTAYEEAAQYIVNKLNIQKQ